MLREKIQLELTLTIANVEAGGMIQGLRALAVLLENQNSVPSTHVRQLTPSCNFQLLGNLIPLASDTQMHTYN